MLGLASVLAAGGFPTAGEACAPQEPGQSYEVHVTRNVMVPMRDGVRLATDIYRPARAGQLLEGTWPVVLYRIPYGKHYVHEPHRAAFSVRPEFFVRHGYVYVAQDSRGRYESHGVWAPFGPQEEPDGFDAVAWITRQPWSNGKVATIGVSYGGLTQLQVGMSHPSGLAAQVLAEIHTNAFKTGAYVGGAHHMRRIQWVVNMALTSQEAARDPTIRDALAKLSEQLPQLYRRFPQAFRRGASALALVPPYEEFLASIIENNRYGPFWHQSGVNVEEHWDRYADVPVYWVGGWYDIYSKQTPQQYVAMRRRKRSPQKLIMGPWNHAREDQSFAGDVEFGLAAAIEPHFLALGWYDQILKGVETGVLEEPPIRIFVMGGGDGHRTPEGRIFHGGEWRFEEEWPLARARNTPFYFQGDGTLSTEAAGASPPTLYLHDPDDPVPTVGGVDAFAYEKGAGAFDQRGADGLPLRLRRDVVVFQTPPLEEGLEVTGPVMVKLYASSSAIDTDFTAKLVDVYPPSPDWPEGFEMNLSDGILRASYRESLTDPTPLEPGRIYELTIEVPPVSNVFQREHRIRVDIASSNFPRFDVNPGTGDHPWERRRYLKAENRIYHDREHPSHVILPVIGR